MSDEYIRSPYETYGLLRQQAPVYWSDRWNGWLITRYDDVQAVMRDRKTFSNQNRYTQYIGSLTEEQRGRLTYLIDHYERGGLVQSDPPDHTRLRKLISGAFTANRVAKMAGLVTEIADSLIAFFCDQDEVELIYHFAFPLPAIVIAGMLGVPAEERDQFKEWSATIQRFLGSGTVSFEYALAAQDAWMNMNGFFEALLSERTKAPKDDLVSAMAQAHEDGERLTKDELIRTCGAMLIAGHETTTNLIASAIWLLHERPDQLKLLRGNPALYPCAVEEVLRFESPFQSAPRTVTADVVIAGQTLRQGDLAYVMLGAANRDPSQFPHPNRFSIERTDNRHVAFGYGIHLCLGAALARLEAPIAIQALLDRFPHMHLPEDRPPVWKRSMVQRGMEQFNVRLG
ncbi:MAG: cytochrome P450 [Phycisphaerales bacterium JB063]